jgi:hypothetical protein
VVLNPKGEPLHPASRLNIAKVHTIEHNIHVAMIGKITHRETVRLRRYSGISTCGLDDFVQADEDGEDEDDAYR